MKQKSPFSMEAFFTSLQKHDLDNLPRQFNQKNANTSKSGSHSPTARNRNKKSQSRNSYSENNSDSNGVSSSTSSATKRNNIRLARLIEPEKFKSPNRRRNENSFSQLLKQQSGGAIAKHAEYFAGSKNSPDPSALPMPPKHWISASNSANSEEKMPSPPPTPKRKKEKKSQSQKPKRIAADVESFFANFNTGSPIRQHVSTVA
jgi:hypothetical protein